MASRFKYGVNAGAENDLNGLLNPYSNSPGFGPSLSKYLPMMGGLEQILGPLIASQLRGVLGVNSFTPGGFGMKANDAHTIFNRADMAMLQPQQRQVQSEVNALNTTYDNDRPLGFLGNLANTFMNNSGEFVNQHAKAQHYAGNFASINSNLAESQGFLKEYGLKDSDGLKGNKELSDTIKDAFNALTADFKAKDAAGNTKFGAEYGGLNLGEIGTIASEVVRTSSSTIDKGKPEVLKGQVKDLSKAISAFKDILGGEVAEVMDKLSDTLGSDVTAMFKDNGARLQTYAGMLKHTARLSNTSLQGALGISQVTGALQEQLAGNKLGAFTSGMMVTATGTPGDMYGINRAKYSSMQSTRTVGAMESVAAKRIAGAYDVYRRKALKDDPDLKEEDIRAQFKNEFDDGPTSDLKTLQDITGTNLESVELENLGSSRAANAFRNEDTFATRAAKKEQINQAITLKKDALGQITAGALNDEQINKIATSTNYKDREKLLTEYGVTDEQRGAIYSQFNDIASITGYKDDNYMMAAQAGDEKRDKVLAQATLRTDLEKKLGTKIHGMAGAMSIIQGTFGTESYEIGSKDHKQTFNDLIQAIGGESSMEDLYGKLYMKDKDGKMIQRPEIAKALDTLNTTKTSNNFLSVNSVLTQGFDIMNSGKLDKKDQKEYEEAYRGLMTGSHKNDKGEWVVTKKENAKEIMEKQYDILYAQTESGKISESLSESTGFAKLDKDGKELKTTEGKIVTTTAHDIFADKSNASSKDSTNNQWRRMAAAETIRKMSAEDFAKMKNTGGATQQEFERSILTGKDFSMSKLSGLARDNRAFNKAFSEEASSYGISAMGSPSEQALSEIISKLTEIVTHLTDPKT